MESALYIDEVFVKHRTPPGHPESPDRIKAIVTALKRDVKALQGKVEIKGAVEGDIDLPLSVHDKEYVYYVKTLAESGGGALDPDTYVSRDSFNVALYAAATVTAAAIDAFNRKYRVVFAAVRPPGHHARRGEGRGFCIFNNVAIAAKKLLNMGVERVAIVDIDVHWGDGTAYIFYDTDQVLYVSLHQDPQTLYPYEGFPYQLGRGKGEGYTVNLPLPPGAGDQTYSRYIDELVIPILEAYSPQAVIVSAGFDTHWEDPLANLLLTINGQWYAMNAIVHFAESYGLSVAMALEGGYVGWVLGKSVVNALLSWQNSPYHKEEEVEEEVTPDEVDAYIDNIKSYLSKYWPI